MSFFCGQGQPDQAHGPIATPSHLCQIMPSILPILLSPLALLYGGLMRLRNYLYDTGQRKSVQFQVCTISIGNLNVGGTGKTPHVEYLIRLLKDRYPVATLSRGYGRKTRGVLLANEQSTAAQIGDEPMQFFAKFGQSITVAVGEERIMAMPEILAQDHPPQVVLLDDAFQHRKLRRHLDLLLTDAANPFYTDAVLPAGRLREGRRGASRADAVLVTKCPDELGEAERATICQKIRHYAGAKPVFFTGLRYLPPQPLFVENPARALSGPVVLCTGIANPQALVRHVRQQAQLIRHFDFADHFSYSPAAMQPVLDCLRDSGPAAMLLTTEKDMVKWQSPALKPLLAGLPIYYLPIEIVFLADQAAFDALILNKVAEVVMEHSEQLGEA